MPKVVVYEPTNNAKHSEVLKAFADGLGVPVHPITRYEPSDYIVFFGLPYEGQADSRAKRTIMELYPKRRTIIIDRAIIRPGSYWSIGFGSLSGDIDYRAEDMPIDRWHEFKVPIKPWRQMEGSVIVAGQIPGLVLPEGHDHAAWCRDTVAYFKLRGYKVLFRPHPRIRDSWREYYPGVPPALVDTRPARDMLSGAQCIVTFNSGLAVEAILEGIPVIAVHKSSPVWDVANHELMAVEYLRQPARIKWLASIGYSQWSIDELKWGLPWAHLTRN